MSSFNVVIPTADAKMPIPVYVSTMMDDVDGFMALDGAWSIATIVIDDAIYAFIPSYIDDGIQIMDITDPYNPFSVYSIMNNVDGFTKLNGTWNLVTVIIDDVIYAVITNKLDINIQIMDITDPYNPIPISIIENNVGEFTKFDGVNDMNILNIDDAIYIIVTNYTDDNVQIIDITDPYNPFPVSIMEDNVDGFMALDNAWHITTIVIDGAIYALISSYNDDGVQIMDVTDPYNPFSVYSIINNVGEFTELEGVWHVITVVIDDAIYAIVGSVIDDNVQIIDITDPYNPFPVYIMNNSIDGFTELNEVKAITTVVIDDIVYLIVASYDNATIQIIDITDPYNPIPGYVIRDGVKGFTELHGIGDITTIIIDNFTYIISVGYLSDGIHIIDITGTLPIFYNAALDEETGMLRLVFNKIINNTDVGDVDLSKLYISEMGEMNEIVLSGSTITTVGNNSTISIILTESQRQSVIALSTPQLDIAASAVEDITGNQILARPNNTISITPDSIPPTIKSVNIVTQNLIEVTFSEIIYEPSVSLSDFTISDPTVTITNLIVDDEVIKLTFTPNLKHTITPNVTLNSDGVTDISGNIISNKGPITTVNTWAPLLLSARISTDTITLIYNVPVATMLSDYSNLTNINATNSTLKLISLTGSNSDIIVLSILTPVPTSSIASIDISSDVININNNVHFVALNNSPITAEDVVELLGDDNVVVINESDSILSSVTYSAVLTNATLNYFALVGVDVLLSNSTNTNNEITITTTDVVGGDIVTIFTNATLITGPVGFNGILNLPEDTFAECANIIPITVFLVSCINIGQNENVLTVAPPVRILFTGQVGTNPFVIQNGIATEILTKCNTDNVSDVSAQLLNPFDMCFINVEDDLVIWTTHFTQFGSGTVLSSGGGSSGESTPPSFTMSFAENTNTIYIGTVGISPTPFKTSYIMNYPISIQIGEAITISLTLYENLSWEYITHLELCLNKQTSNNIICDSDTKIIWDKNDEFNLEIIDPNGLISDASINITQIDSHVATFDYSIIFDRVMDTSNIQIYSWDTKRNSIAFTVENALTVTPRIIHDDSQDVISGNITSSCDAAIVVDQLDGTCMDVQEVDATAQDNIAPTAQNSIVTTPEQIDILKQWVVYSSTSITDTQLAQYLGIINDDSDITFPKWIKNNLGKLTVKNQISVNELKIALSYLYKNLM